MKTKNLLNKTLIVSAMVAGIMGIGQQAKAQDPLVVLDAPTYFSALSPAWLFNVLTYNTPTVSSAAFNGGPIGVVAGDWVQSGGDNSQQSPETVILSPGYNNNGNPGGVVQNTIYNGPLLNQAWTSATTASSLWAGYAASSGLSYSSISSSTLISKSVVGNYVVNINGTVNLSQGNLTFSAPAGSTFLVNITGDVTLTGGSQGNGFLLAGGITPNSVVYNLLGAGNALKTSGGGNAQQLNGTVLAVNGMVSTTLSPAGITGSLITYHLQESSSSMVTYAPIPEPTTIALAGLGGFSLLLLRRKK